ncbi:group II truncated hemoglobin [Gammaproteobacteria bacterium]|nr:group II truncated hemoglobin [Gammaproteobacteria bacterium]
MSEEIENKTPYEILGDQGIKDLANAFYEAMEELPLAADIKAMHSDNLDHVKRMLAAYLTGWMGGPPVYLAVKGTVCLTEPHEPFRIGPKERDQWLACMDAALDKIKASDGLKKMLKEPLFRVAETVRNCDDSTPKNKGPGIIAVG